MIKQIGLASFHDVQVVNHLGCMWQVVADPTTRASVLIELRLAAQQIDAMTGVHERKTFALDKAGRNRLSAQLVELWLVFEGF